MTLRISLAAEQEAREAADRYHSDRPGLGIAFYEELEATFAEILAHPLRFPKDLAVASRPEARRAL
jgi:hypothetical protein